MVDPFDCAQDKFLVVFLCFLAFFVENCSIFDAFCQLFVLSEASMRNIKNYGSPVRDVVNKNSTEPQAAHLGGFSDFSGGQVGGGLVDCELKGRRYK